MRKQNFESLERRYAKFLKANSLPQRDAMELIHEAELTAEQRKWLSDFYLAWQATEKAEQAFRATRKLCENFDDGRYESIRAYVYCDCFCIEIGNDDCLYLDIENHGWTKPNTPDNLAKLERELFNWAYPHNWTFEG